MAIAFDASSTGIHSGFSHVCAGSDRILFVETSGSGTLTGVTYAGVAMTSIGTPAASAQGPTSSVWYLVAPALGSNTIAFSGTSLNLDAEAVSYTGASQAVPEVVSTTASATAASSWTTTLTTLTDNAWLVFAEWSYFFGNAPTAGAGLTLRKIGTNHKNGFFDSNGPKSPTGSHSGTTNQTSGGGWPIQHVAMSVAPVASGASGTGAVAFAKPALAGTGSAVAVASGTGAETFAKPAFAATGSVVIPGGAIGVTQIPVEVAEQTDAVVASVTQIPVEAAASSDAVVVDVTQIALETIYTFSGTCGIPAPDVGVTYPVRRLRTFLLPTSPEGRWLFLRRLQILLQAGVGLTHGQGAEPYVMIQLSRDGGQTWGPERWVTAGRRGEYDVQAFLVNCGRYRDGAVRLVVSDPVAWSFLSADADLMEGTS